MPSPRLRPGAAYALAIALPWLAMAFNLALRRWLEDVPYVLFFLAVSIVSAGGGWMPGLLSVGISAALGYAFLHTSSLAHHQASAQVGALVFLPVGAVSAALGALFRAAFVEREDAALALARSEARERARAAELAEALDARDRFVSAASHELKTPLTSTQLNVQLLRRSLARGASPDPGELARRLGALDRQLGRMTGVVQNLLNASREAAVAHGTVAERLDLSELVREVIERFSAESEAGGSPLALDAPAAVVGMWDRERLDRIVTNLISNAFRYGQGSPIEIRVRLEGDRAWLQVSDQGVGIPADEQQQVFEPYVRGSRTAAAGGLGMGLWIVREAVHALDGTVTVASPAGAGTTFTVVLPLRPGPLGLCDAPISSAP